MGEPAENPKDCKVRVSLLDFCQCLAWRAGCWSPAVANPPRSSITFAEARVLLLLLERRSPREVADELGVSLGTVRTHIKHLHTKSDTHSLAPLVLWGRDDCAEPLCRALSVDEMWSRRLKLFLTSL